MHRITDPLIPAEINTAFSTYNRLSPSKAYADMRYPNIRNHNWKLLWHSQDFNFGFDFKDGIGQRKKVRG